MSIYFKPNQKFIESAHARSQLWRLGLGIVIFGLLYMAATVAVIAVGMVFANPIEIINLEADQKFNTPYLMVVIMSTFVE